MLSICRLKLFSSYLHSTNLKTESAKSWKVEAFAYLGCRIDGELQLGLLAVLQGQAFHQEGREPRTSSSTERVEDQESLQTKQIPTIIQYMSNNYHVQQSGGCTGRKFRTAHVLKCHASLGWWKIYLETQQTTSNENNKDVFHQSIGGSDGVEKDIFS